MDGEGRGFRLDDSARLMISAGSQTRCCPSKLSLERACSREGVDVVKLLLLLIT